MQYRKFGKLDWQASALGFGCMRFPLLEGTQDIDEPKATRMLHYAIDHGVNYLDTAHPYHGGQSEPFVGRALQGGYRDKVRLATKLPCWEVKAAEDFDKYLNGQLGKLQTKHVDFYLLHGLGGKSWGKMRDMGVLDWAEGAIADGRIGHLGFSFHDEYPAFEEIVDACDKWTFCQIQYNYMDVENQAGVKGLKYAASKGLAVIIMEPLLGGKLVNPPQSIQELWDSSNTRRAAADWALQWLWDQPEVSLILSGMSAMQHVEENVASAAVSATGQFSAADQALVEQVRARYDELCPIPCTKCDYCMPCPNGVNIPSNFWLYNEGIMYDKHDQVRGSYGWMERSHQLGMSPSDGRAVNCIQCAECEPKCPQSIVISELMPIMHQVLGEGKSFAECALP
ncbi:MAG: aldo/keto reductase, partial [Chloroflexi bacterium]|nr:aldo/keto reductase [Chloroflexota bacterium]